MTKRPDLSDYNLDERKVSLVSKINSWTVHKKKQFQNFVVGLTASLALIGLCLVCAYILWTIIWLGFGVIFGAGILYYIIIGSDFFARILLSRRDKFIISQNIAPADFELWDKSHSKYASDLYEFEKKEEHDKLKFLSENLNSCLEEIKYKRNYELIQGVHSLYSSFLKEYSDIISNSRFNSYDDKNYRSDYEQKLRFFRSKVTWITTKELNSFERQTKVSSPENNTKTNSTTTETNTTFSKQKEIIPAIVRNETPLIEIVNPFDSAFSSTSTVVSNRNEVLSKPVIISPEEYMTSAENKQKIGDLGELFIIEYEKRKLILNHRTDLANQITHVSKTIGDGAGYDIASFNLKGEKMHIEVKTTIGNLNAPFFITETEYKASKANESYFIYRVFDFDLETKKGKLYIIDTKKDLDKYFNIEPKLYKMTPNKLTS